MEFKEQPAEIPYPLFFILNDNNDVIPCNDINLAMRWKSFFPNCRVGLDIIGCYRVSTVFLGIPHIGCKFKDEGNYFFETMVFNDSDGKSYFNIPFDPDTDLQKAMKEYLGFDIFGNMRRYKTWKEAEAGHNEICRLFESVTGLTRVSGVEEERAKYPKDLY